MERDQKDPAAVKSWGFHWANKGDNAGGADDPGWLDGATIISSMWSIDGPDESLVVEEESNSDVESKVKLSGGIVGRRYRVTNHVVSSETDEDARSVMIEVDYQ